ncbi:MAG TPA: hypothetical protein DCO77_14570 [Nitrospiraceae bacterium]|nr:hypothetical protein [Nitrospiraceae bacterium]
MLVMMVLSISLLMDHAHARENNAKKSSGAPNAGKTRAPYVPVLRIPLRVHLSMSKRPVKEWMVILEEINRIWWSQAGICFEIEAVMHDTILKDGMDIWFSPPADEGVVLNGYFEGAHDIWVRDTPKLRSAPNPARHRAARTAAHEFGHGLGLNHRQDSDDNLMRSQTLGWRLNAKEVGTVRKHAASIALPDRKPSRCKAPILTP